MFFSYIQDFFDQNMVVTLKVNIFHYFTTWIVF